jgi:hypothetical protein
MRFLPFARRLRHVTVKKVRQAAAAKAAIPSGAANFTSCE